MDDQQKTKVVLAIAQHLVRLEYGKTADIDFLPASSQKAYQEDASAILKVITDLGFAVVPEKPSRGLLISMALRMDHAFCAPEQSLFGMSVFGHTNDYRESVLTTLRQAYEEVVGKGFYHPDGEEHYRSMMSTNGENSAID